MTVYDHDQIEKYAKTHMADAGPTHDMHHVYRVLNIAMDIMVNQEDVNAVDMDVLVAACFLHDVGREAQAVDSSLCHAQIGGEMAYEFLLSLEWAEEKASHVRECVQAHRYRGDNEPQSIEAKILFDADKIDVCGAIGIARTFTYIGENLERGIYYMDENGNIDINEPSTFFGEYNYKLKKVYDGFYTQRGEEIAEQRRKNAEGFYDGLLAEVRQSTRQKNNLSEIRGQAAALFEEVIAAGKLKKGDIIVLGCSTSEILGGIIGSRSSYEIGMVVIAAAYDACHKHGVFLAVQACEHLNRALVVNRDCAKAYNLEIVNVLPTSSAGGSCAGIVYHTFEDAVVVEHITAHAGIDIGDTHIGMHVKFVQVPYRPATKKVGNAHVTALTSRPKLIGGERAVYP